MENLHVLVLAVFVIGMAVHLSIGAGLGPVRKASCKECMFCLKKDQKSKQTAMTPKPDPNLNLTECANLCLQTDKCTSIDYNAQTKVCRIFEQTSGGDLAAAVGTEYWGYDTCASPPTYTCTG